LLSPADGLSGLFYPQVFIRPIRRLNAPGSDLYSPAGFVRPLYSPAAPATAVFSAVFARSQTEGCVSARRRFCHSISVLRVFGRTLLPPAA
jgi:hypothetical protein